MATGVSLKRAFIAALFCNWFTVAPAHSQSLDSDVTIPFCARAIDLTTAVNDTAAFNDFLKTFNLKVRPYTQNGQQRSSIPFCGTYSASPKPILQNPFKTFSRYQVNTVTINGKILTLDPESVIDIGNQVCYGSPGNCYEVWISSGLNTGRTLQFWLRSFYPPGTLLTTDLQDNIDFLPRAVDRISVYFGYYMLLAPGRWSALEANTEWLITENSPLLVEFAGPDVKESNLRLRSEAAISPQPITKTVVVDCGDKNVTTLNLKQYLSQRSEKNELNWYWSVEWPDRPPEGSPDALGVVCASFPGYIHVYTVIAEHALDSSVFDQVVIITLGLGSRQKFADWYSSEATFMNWVTLLPPAHSRLALNADDLDPEPGPPGRWQAPCLSTGLLAACHLAWPNNFHMGAAYEMRSVAGVDGHGHQAVYDVDGRLITDQNCPVIRPSGHPCPSAGSADGRHPDFVIDPVAGDTHYSQDVLPFILAAQLDGNPVKGLFGFDLPVFDLDRPLIRVGDHIKGFFEVRPTLPTGTIN